MIQLSSNMTMTAQSVVRTLTLIPVNSRHTNTKSGDKPDTTSTLVKRLLITVG